MDAETRVWAWFMAFILMLLAAALLVLVVVVAVALGWWVVPVFTVFVFGARRIHRVIVAGIREGKF